jgi:hypothetical protein
VHAQPLSLHLPSPVKLQCTLQLSGQIHYPCFISSKNMYSVFGTSVGGAAELTICVLTVEDSTACSLFQCCQVLENLFGKFNEQGKIAAAGEKLSFISRNRKNSLCRVPNMY